MRVHCPFTFIDVEDRVCMLSSYFKNNRIPTDLYPYSTQTTNRPNRHELIFFLFGGIREVSLFFSPIVMSYESFPIQIRCHYEYSGKSAQFG